MTKVLKKIKVNPRIEKINIISLPFKIFFFISLRSSTINLDALDKVESNVDIAETIKSKKTIYETISPKFNFIAVKKEILSNDDLDK